MNAAGIWNMIGKLIRPGGGRNQTVARESAELAGMLERAMASPETRGRIDYVLSIREDDPRLLKGVGGGERALPGFEKYRASGWWKHMITRYALALHYSANQTVLDSCCGLGWGSYLLKSAAREVVAVDLDQSALKAARALWPDSGVRFLRASVLDLPLESECVDVALAMESVEHFRPDDIGRYLDQLARVLKPGGVLVGSSYFPDTREEADKVRARNSFHLHICTREEIDSLLANRFATRRIFENRLYFLAGKAKGV